MPAIYSEGKEGELKSFQMTMRDSQTIASRDI